MEMSRRQLEICLSLERCIGELLVVFKAIGLDRIPDKKEPKQNLMVQPALVGRLQRENPNRRLGRSSQRRGCTRLSILLSVHPKFHLFPSLTLLSPHPVPLCPTERTMLELLRVYYVPDTILSTLHILSIQSSHRSILQMRKVRHREGQQVVQGHTGSKGWSRDSNPAAYSTPSDGENGTQPPTRKENPLLVSHSLHTSSDMHFTISQVSLLCRSG